MNDDPDQRWATIGRGLIAGLLAACLIVGLYLAVRVNVYNPAFNDGFEAGRKAMWIQCVERNGGQCPDKQQLGWNG